MYFLFLFGGEKKRKKKGKTVLKEKKWVQQNKSDMFQCYNAPRFLNFISKNFCLKNTKTLNVVPNAKTRYISHMFHPMQNIIGDITISI